MRDEVSESIRLSVTVFCTAGLLSVVIQLLLYGNLTLNGFSERWQASVSNTGLQSIISAENQTDISGPNCYKLISDNISMFESITIVTKSDGTKTYNFKLSNVSTLDYLYTKAGASKYYVLRHEENHSSGMIKLTLEEVDK